MKNIKKGYSLLELMLVLAIISALVVFAFISYNKVHNRLIAQKTVNDIYLIMNSVREMYQGNSKPAQTTNYTILLQAIQNDLKNTDMTILTSGRNLKYGSILLSPGSGGSVPGFTLSYTLPNDSSPELCTQIVNQLYANMSQQDTIYIYSSSDSNYITKNIAGSLYSVDTVVESCQKAVSIILNTGY